MIKKTIPFKDLDGNLVEEEFYFNLNKVEALELQFSHEGGLEEHAKRIVKTKDMKQLIELFKELLVRTVGKRSEDGRRFIKNQTIVDEFTQSEAYSELFLQLSTDEVFAISFMKGILPKDLQEQINRVEGDPAEPANTEPAWVSEGRVPTSKEISDATPDQLRLAFQRKQDAEPPSS